ncbi:TIGR02677 family protein [Trujillonella humicola]|uniref:TIGR02677 family protein n=1 Tax=Trujillonella humicola TaxID=3383699 RepID=UPI003905FFC4
MDATEPAPTGDDEAALDASAARLDLYRYVGGAEHTGDYLAIMRLFGSGLLIDLSAAELAERLAEQPGRAGPPLDVDTVEDRCDQLVRWGNLVRSVRDARVRTIADWQRARTRYQISKLGGRVQRQVDELLTTTEGAREVARELLAGTADRLALIRRLATGETVDPERLAAEVTTLFGNQRVFLDSLADFYAYLATVLSRYDLAGEEYATFKGVLLDYVDLLGSDVGRHAPLVVDRLAELQPHVPTVVARLAELPGLTGDRVERLPGRTERDWAEFATWFTEGAGRSGPDRLRAAAEQALGQLLTNAKRMVSAAGTGLSRRDDLLRLAAVFAACDDDETAHRLWAATFGAAPARHLALGPEDDDGRIPPTESWWDAPPVDVPVSVREQGDRTARGRSARVPDPGLDRARLLAEADAEAATLRAAAAELSAAGRLHGARLSPAARDLLLDQLAAVIAVDQLLDRPAERFDADLGFTLRVEPGADTVVDAADGRTTVHGLALSVVGADVVDGDDR